uniref:Fucosyltransferase 10 n=1 Tax=Rousettus aegyptiacus TaxID=9407 RepID=A0A7J8DXG7_ROUAE|nr:fucosyltransferase 10 [Rousettus aegyptiacus]
MVRIHKRKFLASCLCITATIFLLVTLQGLPPKRWKAEVTHLSCPEPTAFAFSPLAQRWSSLREMWIPSFEQSKKEAQALRWLVDRNQNFSAQEFWALVFKD